VVRAPRRLVATLSALALAVGAGGCGYGFSQRYRARGGAQRVFVRTFENRSADPEMGAALTASLRERLARRGASGGPDAPAVIEGEVEALEGVPSSAAGETFHVAIEARARLRVGGETVAEHVARRHGDHLGGADAPETEGRRALALRALADDAALEILRAFEAGAP
jgi:hypothetical protein